MRRMRRRGRNESLLAICLYIIRFEAIMNILIHLHLQEKEAIFDDSMIHKVTSKQVKSMNAMGRSRVHLIDR